jgi:hypothetical protein
MLYIIPDGNGYRNQKFQEGYHSCNEYDIIVLFCQLFFNPFFYFHRSTTFQMEYLQGVEIIESMVAN